MFDARFNGKVVAQLPPRGAQRVKRTRLAECTRAVTAHWLKMLTMFE